MGYSLSYRLRKTPKFAGFPKVFPLSRFAPFLFSQVVSLFYEASLARTLGIFLHHREALVACDGRDLMIGAARLCKLTRSTIPEPVERVVHQTSSSAHTNNLFLQLIIIQLMTRLICQNEA